MSPLGTVGNTLTEKKLDQRLHARYMLSLLGCQAEEKGRLGLFLHRIYVTNVVFSLAFHTETGV